MTLKPICALRALAVFAITYAAPSMALQFGALQLDSSAGNNFIGSVPIVAAPNEPYQYAVYRVSAFDVQTGNDQRSNAGAIRISTFGGSNPHLELHGPVVPAGALIRVSVEATLQGKTFDQSYSVRVPGASSSSATVQVIEPAPLPPTPVAAAPMPPPPPSQPESSQWPVYTKPAPAPAHNSMGDVPMVSIAGYGGGGTMRAQDDVSSDDNRSVTNYGGSLWAVVAKHLLIAGDYDFIRGDLDAGETIEIGRWTIGLGYVGPISRSVAWYIKGFATGQKWDLRNDPVCGSCGSNRTGGGAGGGVVIAFARRFSGRLDGAIDYVGKDGGAPSITEGLFEGRIEFKPVPTFGLWAGYLSRFDFVDTPNNARVNILTARAGVALEF